MSYLVVPGKYDSQALLRLISEARRRGQAAHRRRRRPGGADERADQHHADGREGNTADIAIYDVRDKNGIMHVVDHMLEPGGPARQVAAN